MSLTHKIVIVAAVFLVGLGSFWPLQTAVGESSDADEVLAVAPAQDKTGENKDHVKKTEDAGSIKTSTKKIAVYKNESMSKPPKLIKSDPPYFPDEAKKAGTGANVVVKLLVLADGKADSVTVDVKSDGHEPAFEKAVREAVGTWEFEPARNDAGEAIKSWVNMTIQFRLDDCDGAVKKKNTEKTMVKPKSEENG